MTDINHNELPKFITELVVKGKDDDSSQKVLFGYLNERSYNQVEVDLFELTCGCIERSLFSQVDWARNNIFFKDLKVSQESSYVSIQVVNLCDLGYVNGFSLRTLGVMSRQIFSLISHMSLIICALDRSANPSIP